MAGLFRCASQEGMLNLTLERVVYISEATRPDPEILLLADILATSGRNNQRDGLTGALLVTSDRFLQVLEGARQDLDRTLDRLYDDPRHHGVQILHRAPSDKRGFGQWTMVAARIAPSRAAVMDEVVGLAKADPEAATRRIRDLVQDQLSVT